MRHSEYLRPKSKETAMTKAQTMAAARSRRLKVGISLAFGAWSLVIPAHGQYSIDWHKIAGGGGASTSGVYQVNGTIGQVDAGSTMTNGQFSLQGGYWVLPQAIQIEGAPTLTINPASPGFATISWAPNTAGFVLQETWSLSPPNWTNSPSGSLNPVTIGTDGTARYFRLHKP
jgi:hypothetical protein